MKEICKSELKLRNEMARNRQTKIFQNSGEN